MVSLDRKKPNKLKKKPKEKNNKQNKYKKVQKLRVEHFMLLIL